ncbi:MAG: hypothetical protein A3G40_01660 [Deltaproteobacteria bacterium RIFCSPLOWO2_12_FULL_57_22]|nr:MAG: hypothetical protein A3G40_01660 [Deltaproteobacteria bacterium RIFCSPLOWO2_12_FULL_57_22]
MMKIVRFVRKRRDMTTDEFKKYWLTKHSELEKMVVQKTPVRKITASFATGELKGGKELPFDGLAEIYFDSVEDMKVFYESEIHKTGVMRKDEENFVDMAADPIRVVTEEYVVAEKTEK